ncbi:hypothetical protein LNQ82_08515 [Conchiformibius steedae DSM 2580]|uniref:Uncharacterized protein n=1 Tax=Conchiformibius steedae DSM 2580 TaxID=1121352 RepID=A0AAE9HWS2_9NEIS|nr:hypothetical protein [Conchiformibius steedae]QMT34438.1 hypothetical protein H3L98_05610 [Conchiformibius steedae]URD67220.1 hypothetical protein LNQ82_08515 [Conchiformibius steedae DSM 2580]
MSDFSDFHYQEQVYDLSHLEPMYVSYIQAAGKAGETEKIYRCIVEFSGHCFTKAPNQAKGETLADFPSDLHCILPKETRIFCFERYAYSKKLPQIIQELAQRKCFFTSADDKFLTVEVEGTDGERVDYEIYFSLKKSRDKRCDVYIFINSAYIRDKERQQHTRYKPVSFYVLLNNTVCNKRIKRPK